MKKTLSIFLSFLVLTNLLYPVSYGQSSGSVDVGDQNDQVQEISTTTENSTQENPEISEIIEQEPKNTEINTSSSFSESVDDLINLDVEPISESMITNSGQGGQVLDSNLNTGVKLEENSLNIEDSSVDYGQSGSVLDIEISQNQEEFFDILPTENFPIENQDFQEIEKPGSETVVYDLILSEVFFDGTNERIEIYNDGLDAFSGDLIISGASASNKTINSLTINPGETKIFTDTSVDSILDTSDVFQTNMGFSVSDSSSINIDIIYSGEVLDNFFVDSTTVSSLVNKIGFHRFIDTKNILQSDSNTTFNTTTGYIANPGTVYNEIQPPSDPELKITEIYFDGEEERFEITNIGSQSFSGELILSGGLNFSIFTQISAGISKVFANDIYSMFQTGENIQTIASSIDFDTGEINLDLIRSGQVLDNFFAHETQVQYYDQAETSFEKIGSQNSRTSTVVGLSFDRFYNTNRGISANPTTYFTTGENLIDVSQAREETTYNQSLPIDCDDFRDTTTANISEVYFGNDLYDPYIEIITQDNVYDYYPYIMLEGSALSGGVAFDSSDMEINKKFLISSTDQRYYEGRESLYDSNFSLNSSGRIVLYGRDDWSMERTVLDIVYIDGGEPGISNYIGTTTNECADVFDYQDKFSPGLTIGQSQFIEITPDPIIQYISVSGGGGSCPDNSQETFNSSDIQDGEIQISSIKHYGNLQILKLKNKTDNDINLRDYNLQSLDGITQNIKGNTLFAKTTMSFVGNYGFSTNQDYCVNLLKDGDVVDRYCRNSMSKATEKDESYILDQLSFRIDDQDVIDEEIQEDLQDDQVLLDQKNINPLQTNTIKITNIDYNPDGSDKDNESVSLLLLSGSQVDLSNYTIQYTKDGKSKNKTINGILSYGSEQTFKGNYTFPNSTKDKNPVVVNLIDSNNYIVDTYSYNPNKITEIPNGEYKVISVIDGDTIKISYFQQEFNIRLAGIDAPESSTLRCGKVECFGPEAKVYLNSILNGTTIVFQQESTDDFDRFVGYVFLNGENINQKMIKNGYAREYSYKNNDYKYKSDFKSAQEYAVSNKLGIRGSQCNGQRLCPVEETQINKDYVFNIEDLVYDPEGADTDNETITIYMQKGFTVDFADGFYLMINDTKRYLKKYGIISPGETKTLKGTFSFPNSKKTTVSLYNGDDVFDTYIYDPELDKLLEQENTTGNQEDIQDSIQFSKNISIVSVLPNPVGKDSLGEEIGLLYYLDLQGQAIDLSSGYYLKIGDRKKYLEGVLVPNQETLITGNFALPNKASCVELGFHNIIIDKFCYPEPKEGEKYFVSNGAFESISTIDFSILNSAKLENIGNQVCLTYEGQRFYCKNMPYSKLSTKRLNQNALYKEFFDVFEGYLKDQWKIMYYDTNIKTYFDLLNEIEKAISDGKSTFNLEGKLYQTSEFQNMYESIYPQDDTKFINTKISEFIPKPIREKYIKLKEEYIDYLFNNG